MSRMHQISDADLAELERLVPVLADVATMSPEAANRHKVAARVCKRVLSDVRWNYGPPDEVEEHPA